MRSPPARPPALRAVALTVVLVVSTVTFGMAVGPAAAADARVTLTDTTVTPATPTVGAPITAETTLRLSAGSDTSMTVDEVRVVNPSDDAVLGTATDLGRLSPGETLDVPVAFTVNESGSQDLRLVAVGTDSDGDRVEASRPLTVGVEPGAPQIEVGTERVVAGAESPVQATVSNPTTAPLRGIEVGVEGGESRRTVPTLAAGGSETVNLTAVVPESGDGTVDLRTTYTTPNGVERERRTSAAVTVESLSTDVGIRTQRPQDDDTQQAAGDLTGLLGGGGGTGALQSQSDSEGESSASRVDVTVTNFGNTPIDEVVLTAEDGEGARLGSVGRFALAETLAPGEETTVTVDLSRVRSTDGVRFVAGYETPRGRNETALRYDYRARRGEATLTGLDVTVDDDGRVTVDGNLANVGDGEVESAVVAIQPAEGVEPAYPQRDYFVGSVDASSFAPFELTAQADVETASQVPLQVTYAVEGEQVVRNTTVPLPAAQGSSGGGPVSPAIAVAILLGLAAAAGATVYVVRYR